MLKRRTYSAEVKQSAVGQTRQPGVSWAQVARELSIDANLLTHWRREAKNTDGQAFWGTGTPRDQEIAARKR